MDWYERITNQDSYWVKFMIITLANICDTIMALWIQAYSWGADWTHEQKDSKIRSSKSSKQQMNHPCLYEEQATNVRMTCKTNLLLLKV